MDVSDKYVNMCRKALEVQDYYKGHTVELGDFYWHRNNGIGVIGNEDLFNRPFIVFWLSRLDQLIDMLEGNFKLPSTKLMFFSMWDEGSGAWSKCGCETLEQLFLVCIMWVQYKKKWDKVGEKWTTIDFVERGGIVSV